MENKIFFQAEENNNIMQVEDKSLLKNNSIEGNGSGSQLESINSTKKEITHSTFSSVNPIDISNNSINNSNDNNKMPISDQSSSFNKEKKAQINGSFEGVVDSKLSAIQNFESSSSKEEISTLFNGLNKNNNSQDSEIKSDITLNSIKPLNNENKDNINVINDKVNNININDNSKDDNQKDQENINDLNFIHDLIKEDQKIEIYKKIEKGYFPFFIKIEGYKPSFYYIFNKSKLKTIIKDYLKTIHIPNENNYSFYNGDKLIDLNTTFEESNLKALCLIVGKIK